MSDYRARLTPLAWVVLIVIALVIVGEVLPVLFSIAIAAAIVWGSIYAIAFICTLFGVD